jgi:organic radical activating enzyme
MIDSLQGFHIEPTNICTLKCAGCARTRFIDQWPQHWKNHSLDIDQLLTFLDVDLTNKQILLSGNYGDPIASSYINELVSIAKKYVKKIQIHTNGSLRNANWWHEFANQLADIEHDVWFGIDGLEGVHEIYRQGTDFNKIMQNATSFIDAGGYATWQFIPYKHNEHQTKDCFKLSQKMKFKKFKLAKLYRKQTVAKHYKTGIEFELLPADSLKLLTNINRPNTTVELHNCMHLSIPSVYMSANGKLSRCCYLSNQDRFTDTNMLLNTMTDLNDQHCVKSCG